MQSDGTLTLVGFNVSSSDSLWLVFCWFHDIFLFHYTINNMYKIMCVIITYLTCSKLELPVKDYIFTAAEIKSPAY